MLIFTTGVPLYGPLFNRAQARVRRAVDNFSERVEPGAVTGAIPGVFGVIPVHNATQMRAYCRALMQSTVSVAVGSDLIEAMPDHPSRSRRKVADLIDVSGSGVISILRRHVEAGFDEFRRRSQGNARGIVESFPRVPSAHYQISDENAGPRLRSSEGAKFRIHSFLGLPCVLALPDAASELQELRRDG